MEPRRDPRSDPRPETTTVRAGPIEAAPATEPVFDQASVALVGVAKGRIEAFNGAAQRLFGHSAAAARGTELADLFVPFHADRVREALDRAARGIPSFPSLLANRGGSAPTEVDVRVGPLTVGGEIVGATLVILDARAQNRSIRELQADRDAAIAGEQAVRASLRDLQSSPIAESVPMVPGTLFEAAVPIHANVVVDLSEGLYETFSGRADAIHEVVRLLLDQSAKSGPVVLRGQIQVRRCEWALVRLEIVESERVERSDTEWTRLRRLATELEGAIGHERCADGERRVWLTFNLTGRQATRQPTRNRLAGAQVALDVRYEAERAALTRRLRSWQIRVFPYSEGQTADLILSDRLPSSGHVVHLGNDIPRPIRRDVLHEIILSRLAAARSAA